MNDAANRFDHDVSRAWREFRGTLADHIAGMHENQGLVLEPWSEETTGPAGPCVQFYTWATDTVRCEVPSNAHLSDDRKLRPRDELLLQELGWQAPSHEPDQPDEEGSSAFWMDRPSSWADELAEISVTVLREIWGVPHPLFLRSETFGDDDLAQNSFAVPAPVAESRLGGSLYRATTAHDEDDLRLLIEHAVSSRTDDVPVWDEEGDLLLRMSGVPVYVRAGVGTVDVLAPLVHSITGRTRAAEVVGDLNRQWPHLKFVLVDDRVAVVDHLPAEPFVPVHLVSALDRLAGFLEAVDVDFAVRLGGLPTAEEDFSFDSDIPFDEFPSTPDDPFADSQTSAPEPETAGETPRPAPKPRAARPDRPSADQPALFDNPDEPTLFD